MKFRRLLILAAMKEEADSIRATFQNYPKSAAVVGHHWKVSTETFEVGSQSLTLAQSGMGPVNAALTLLTLWEHQGPTAHYDGVILIGVGGSLVPGLDVGDLVLAQGVFQHDYYSSHETSDYRMRPGEFVLADEAPDHHELLTATNSELLSQIRSNLSHVRLNGARVHEGIVVSGNEFVDTTARKKFLSTLVQNAILVDMEAAGVAQVCSQLKIPFVVAKTVADRLNPNGSIESDFFATLQHAAHNAAQILIPS